MCYNYDFIVNVCKKYSYSVNIFTKIIFLLFSKELLDIYYSISIFVCILCCNFYETHNKTTQYKIIHYLIYYNTNATLFTNFKYIIFVQILKPVLNITAINLLQFYKVHCIFRHNKK